MTEKLKAAAVEKLRQAGCAVESETVINAICRDIAKITGTSRRRGQTMVDYIQSYVKQPDASDPDQFVPQKALPPKWGHRSAYVPAQHLRQAEIDRMPRPIAMSGPGLGGGSGMGRGR